MTKNNHASLVAVPRKQVLAEQYKWINIPIFFNQLESMFHSPSPANYIFPDYCLQPKMIILCFFFLIPPAYKVVLIVSHLGFWSSGGCSLRAAAPLMEFAPSLGGKITLEEFADPRVSFLLSWAARHRFLLLQHKVFSAPCVAWRISNHCTTVGGYFIFLFPIITVS